MDTTQLVLQTLASKIGKLEVENICLLAEIETLKEQLSKDEKEGE